MLGNIVEIHTKDKVRLHGLLCNTFKGKNLIVTIHGGWGNFYQDTWYDAVNNAVKRTNWNLLTTNNRGHDRETTWDLFEKCLIDIQSWIDFANEKGFKKIILLGHSLGTLKVLYYLSNQKKLVNVTGAVILSLPNLIEFGKKTTGKDYKKALILAKSLEVLKKGKNLMPKGSYHSMISAQTFLSLFGPKSKLNEFDFQKPNHNYKIFNKIKVPAMFISGEKDTFISRLDHVFNKIKEINSDVETHIIKKSDHWFTGHNKELQELIENWLNTNF